MTECLHCDDALAAENHLLCRRCAPTGYSGKCPGCGDPLDEDEVERAFDIGAEHDGILCDPCLAAELARERREERRAAR